MTPAQMIEKLDELCRSGKFYGFSIWPTPPHGYQVSLATTSKTNWRIRRADTPSEGLALVLAMDFMDNGVSEPDREPEMIEPRDFDEAALPPEAHEEPEDAVGIFD
ncbi:MAG: hypothetical protein ACXWLZ_00120 [Rhizomicrobium sp.]